MSKPSSPFRRVALRGLAVLLALLALDQIVLRVLVQSDQIFGYPLLPYFPPEFESGHLVLDELLVPDTELGWRLATPEEGGTIELDWTGGRLGAESLSPRKQPGVERVLLLGGSIALGSGLPKEASLAAQLDSQSERYEVINFSTPLYGIDQALLRLRADGLALKPDEVWLTLEKDTVLVATTRYLPFVRRKTNEELFKPRFRLLESGELELLALPTEPELLLTNRDRYLSELALTEMWASTQGTFAIPGLGEQFFTTKFAASLALASDLERDMHLEDSESLAFRTLVALVLQIEHEVTAAGARLRILPLRNQMRFTRNAESLFLNREFREIEFSDALRSHGLELINYGMSTRISANAIDWSAGDHAGIAASILKHLDQEP